MLATALSALTTRTGRAVLIGAAAFLALVLWTHWNRQDARTDLLTEQGAENVEIVRKADRSAYDWRECIVSGGVWDFAAARCRDPE